MKRDLSEPIVTAIITLLLSGALVECWMFFSDVAISLAPLLLIVVIFFSLSMGLAHKHLKDKKSPKFKASMLENQK